jgi:uncharacterized protein
LPGAGNRANLLPRRKGALVEQTGEYLLAASRDVVWSGLNDPDVLGRCIDGCQSIEKTADDRFEARVKAKVGPVRATFTAELTLIDVVAPERYTIRADVKGGPAGFARGTAHVNLTESDDGTLLAYRVDANVGGKLAQVGSRLIDGTARKMADDFFAAFHREMGGSGDGASESRSEDRSHTYESGGRWLVWLAAFVALLLALLFAI